MVALVLFIPISYTFLTGYCRSRVIRKDVLYG
nr:MAG TPA: chitin synthase regulator [Caudoviricetes sp.]